MDGELAFGDTSPLAATLRKLLGVGPYDAVQIRTPTFDRDDGKRVTIFPQSAAFLDALKRADAATLRDIGLRPWDKGDDLWLFPAEWYDHIPEGYPVSDISGEVESFRRGVTDNDKRFGVLAYGIRAARSE